jgi:hypothetical protein
MFIKNYEISDFMKNRQSGADLFHADRRTDGHDEASIRYSNLSNVPKTDSP